MIEQTLDFVLSYWLPLSLCFVCVVYAKSYFHHGLSRYPGPVIARFTNFWRLHDVWKDHHAETLIQLHKDKGSVIRTGPNTISVSDPEWISRIYAINKGIVKTDFYEAFQALANGKVVTNLFATRDEDFHAAVKKPIASMFAAQNLVSYEPLVDSVIVTFMDRLQAAFGGGKESGVACNMADWLQFYAFDVILNMTFSSSLGFLEQGKDVGDFMRTLERNLAETAVVAQVPWTRKIWMHNPLIGRFLKQNHVFPKFVGQQIQEHAMRFHSVGGGTMDENAPKEGMQDMLYRMLAIQAKDPKAMSDYTIYINCMANAIAGSDTTAISLRAIVYFLLSNPEVKAKLLRELRAANLSYPVTWKESQTLPYLDACVKESLRLFPAVGLGLERRVPSGGMEMPDGYVVPEGTHVSMNPWVVHHNRSIFGEDADVYNPDRWLQAKGESDAQYEERQRQMGRANLTFGAGKRICLGRHISLLEIYKVVPCLLLEFDLELTSDKGWRTSNRWFVRQYHMDCWVKRRVN